MVFAMVLSGFISGIATWAWNTGWFWWFVAVELAATIATYVALRRTLSEKRWESLE
ncbi:hypothetical protein D3C83_310420 [compost metagenome]